MLTVEQHILRKDLCDDDLAILWMVAKSCTTNRMVETL